MDAGPPPAGSTSADRSGIVRGAGPAPSSGSDRVRVDRADRDPRVVTITLDRPEVYNAFDLALSRGLSVAVDTAAADAAVVVVRGAGGNFSVGGDVEEVRRLREHGPDALAELFEAFGAALASVERCAVPVIAAVEGYALAGGFELLQVCDIVVVSETAQLGDHHIRAGQLPAGGGSQRLPRLVGRQRALAHLLTGDRIDAATAVAWGLAYRAAPPDGFDAVVDDVVDRVAAKDPAAVRALKSLVVRGLAGSLDDGLRLERAAVLDPSSWQEFT